MTAGAFLHRYDPVEHLARLEATGEDVRCSPSSSVAAEFPNLRDVRYEDHAGVDDGPALELEANGPVAELELEANGPALELEANQPALELEENGPVAELELEANEPALELEANEPAELELEENLPR